MHVLVTEAKFGDSDRLVERLRRLGCRVSTCHGQSGLCRVLAPGDHCPLDRHEPVDLMVDVRDGCDELTSREFGTVCAIRAEVPLLIVGVDPAVPAVVPAGLQRFARAVSADHLSDAVRDIISSRESHRAGSGAR